MTMDVHKNMSKREEKVPDCETSGFDIESARITELPKMDIQPSGGKSSKRSFDVAFLMMPDEKVSQKKSEKQVRVSKQLFPNSEWEPRRRLDHYSRDSPLDLKDYEHRISSNNNLSPGFSSDINIDVGTDEYPNRTVYCSDSENSERSRSRPNSNESAVRPKFFPESPFKNKIFDDPSLISLQTRARFESRFLEMQSESSPKSAFTKVSNFTIRSPDSSVSPDNLLYQNSVSPPLSRNTPPASNFSKLAFNNLLTSAHMMNGNNLFRSRNTSHASPNYDVSSRSINSFNKVDMNHDKDARNPQIHPNKVNYLPFRTDMPQYLPSGPGYHFGVQNFPAPSPEFMKLPSQPRDPVNPLIVNPAAAILSTLLPPTLAAFSLPAQNVCAKCNISFRMTSDLVYHMRTHHKSESSADPTRRKREDKLKCPVCNESFRERHHLTRHMTAHQDKEGDLEDVPSSSYKKSKQYFSTSNGSIIQK